MDKTQSNQQALALLDWYREMGADEVVAESPEDWLADKPRAPGVNILKTITQSRPSPQSPAEIKSESRATTNPSNRSPGSSTDQQPSILWPESASRTQPQVGEYASITNPAAASSSRSFQNVPPDESLAAARQAVQSVGSLEALHEKLLSFEGCGLKATAKNTCFYRGAQNARVMIIGEAPGRDEDLEGRPFVGRAGQLLDRMLKAIDLNEQNVHITNIVYWRPPGNRTPTQQEARVCRPFLEQQIHLVSPQFIILLGGAAAKNILETTQGIMRLRGKWDTRQIAGKQLNILPTLHPAYLLRTPAAKRLAWRDFLSIKHVLSNKN